MALPFGKLCFPRRRDKMSKDIEKIKQKVKSTVNQVRTQKFMKGGASLNKISQKRN